MGNSEKINIWLWHCVPDSGLAGLRCRRVHDSDDSSFALWPCSRFPNASKHKRQGKVEAHAGGVNTEPFSKEGTQTIGLRCSFAEQILACELWRRRWLPGCSAMAVQIQCESPLWRAKGKNTDDVWEETHLTALQLLFKNV